MDNRNTKDLVWFYDSINYKISAPTNPDRNAKVGVTWMSGHLIREDFEKKIRRPLEEGEDANEVIALDRFEVPDDDVSVDPVYYNSHERLGLFEDPVAVRAKADNFIAGVRDEDEKAQQP